MGKKLFPQKINTLVNIIKKVKNMDMGLGLLVTAINTLVNFVRVNYMVKGLSFV